MKINRKARQWIVTLVLVLLWCAAAWGIANHHYASRMREVVAEQRLITEERAADLSVSIRRNVQYLSGIPNMLARLVRVNKAVAMFGAGGTPSTLPYEERKGKWTNDRTLNDLSLYLAVVQASLNVDIVFLVDAAGDAIASSNWDKPGSSIGMNYAGRDWFTSNMEGEAGMQYALGKTTHIPGLYFSSPVFQEGRFMGAVVVKIDLANLSFITTQTDAYITDQNGVIILAHDKSLEMHALPGAAIFGMTAQKRLERYQRSDFPTLSIQSFGYRDFPELMQIATESAPHLRASRTLPEYGLTAYIENDLQQFHALEHERLLAFIVWAFAGSALILAVSGAYSHVRSINRSKRVLQQSEDRYRTLIESSPLCVHEIDLQGRFMSMNRSGLHMLGYADEGKVCGMSFLGAVSAADQGRVATLFQDALNGKSCHFEFATTGDRPSYFKSCFVPIRDADGRVVKLMGLTEDISERKQAEVLEQQRLDELEAIYQLSNAVGNAGSLEQIYETVIDYMLRLLGADRVAIMLSDAQGVMRFKAWRGLSDNYRQVMDGHAPWDSGEADPQPTYIEDLDLDSLPADMRDVLEAEGIRSFSCVPLHQHGHLLGKLTVCFDAPHHFTESENKLAQTIASHVAFAIDRKYAELQFAAIFEFAPDAIVMTDMQATITMINRQAETLFGYAHDELIGQSIDVLIPKDAPNERRDMRQRFLASAMRPRPLGASGRKDLRGISKDGRIFPVEISLSPMQTQNGMVIAAAVRDVSGRKQVMDQLLDTARELEQANAQIEEERALLATRVEERTAQLQFANRAKDSFLATMSHEIRTPLGGLLGMMELLSISGLNDEQTEMVKVARNSGSSLLRIVDDILDWSKIEAGKLVIAPRVANVAVMIKGVVSTYAQVASAKGIRLRQRVDESLGTAHLFDPLRVSQILNNFTSNAIKFTEQGTVEISAELLSQHEGCEEVRFCVRDSGVGITAAEQARLFQQYEQASADTARMYGGTGLGLAICRSLAELMEGTISVESTAGQGSSFCFTIRLPMANPTAQRDLQLRLARADTSEIDVTPLLANGKPVSVLIVDDHPVNRMLLKQQLELLGIQADVAAYGIVALALWQTGNFDLIITDCHMPEMDGYELTRSIREIERQDERQRIPVIAWTANVLADERERCRAAGMDDLLTKPTELSELRTMLSKWLDKVEVMNRHLLAAQMSAIAHSPVATVVALDFEVLNRIAKNPVAQAEILQEFNQHNRSDIANLIAALQDGNPAAVARSAHRIKGACRMVGALELGGICAAIELAATHGDLDSARAAADNVLVEANARVEAAVESFVAGA